MLNLIIKVIMMQTECRWNFWKGRAQRKAILLKEIVFFWRMEKGKEQIYRLSLISLKKKSQNL